MPFRVSSGDGSSQLRLGNSAQRPTYSLSSSDQVTRYVYRSFCNITLRLQAFNRFQHLFYLICLCHSFIILDIDSRVALPGCFVDSVTTAFLPSLTKEGIAHFAKVLETYPFGIASHFSNEIVNLCHAVMIPLLILASRFRFPLIPPAWTLPLPKRTSAPVRESACPAVLGGATESVDHFPALHSSFILPPSCFLFSPSQSGYPFPSASSPARKFEQKGGCYAASLVVYATA
ncbi:MAG: hypothetical protein FD146_1695 [Anaerolineaceae bacterium]|nr:MAG: hypothetical protein FD146_1695 [Anaerolineaceae bacterium]